MTIRPFQFRYFAVGVTAYGLSTAAAAATFNLAPIFRAVLGTHPAVAVSTSVTLQVSPPADQTPTSRALPSPVDSPPFPLPDWAVNGFSPIGESWDASTGPLQKTVCGSKLDASRIKVY